MPNPSSQHNPPWIKVIGLLLLICFTSATISWSAPDISVVPAHQHFGGSHEVLLPSLAQQIEIPEEIGNIKERVVSAQNLSPAARPLSPVIVHIQDAHSHYESQINTKKILEYLNKEYQFDLVFVEGSMRGLNPELLEFFTDAKLNEKTVDILAREGLLSGVELYLVGKGQEGASYKGQVYGVENRDLYRKNLSLFRRVIKQKGNAERFLDQLKGDIFKASSKIFNKRLKGFFYKWVSHEDQEEFLQHIEMLQKYALQDLKVDFGDLRNQLQWPQLVRFFKLKELEKKVDAKKAEAEKRKLIQWMRSQKLSKEYAEFIWNPRKSRQSPRSFFEKFYDIASPKGFSFKAYPAFSQKAGLTILESELQADDLFAEANRLTESILEKLAVTEKERELIILYQDYKLLKKLLTLELTREECEQVLFRKEKIMPSALVKRMGFRGPNTQYPTPDTLFSQALHFYSIAKIRESVMSRKMLSKMKELKKANAVLITGGFHSAGLLRQFKDKKISYVEVMPHISEVGKNETYQNVMLGEGNYLTLRSYLSPSHIAEEGGLPALYKLDSTSAFNDAKIMNVAIVSAAHESVKNDAEKEKKSSIQIFKDKLGVALKKHQLNYTTEGELLLLGQATGVGVSKEITPIARNFSAAQPARAETRTEQTPNPEIAAILTKGQPVYDSLIQSDQPIVDQLLSSGPDSFYERFKVLLVESKGPFVLRLVPSSKDEQSALLDLPFGFVELENKNAMTDSLFNHPIQKMLLSQDRILVRFNQPVTVNGIPTPYVTLVGDSFLFARLAKKYFLENYESVVIPEESYYQNIAHYVHSKQLRILESGLGLPDKEAKMQFLNELGLKEIPSEKFLSEEEWSEWLFQHPQRPKEPEKKSEPAKLEPQSLEPKQKDSAKKTQPQQAPQAVSSDPADVFLREVRDELIELQKHWLFNEIFAEKTRHQTLEKTRQKAFGGVARELSNFVKDLNQVVYLSDTGAKKQMLEALPQRLKELDTHTHNVFMGLQQLGIDRQFTKDLMVSIYISLGRLNLYAGLIFGIQWGLSFRISSSDLQKRLSEDPSFWINLRSLLSRLYYLLQELELKYLDTEVASSFSHIYSDFQTQLNEILKETNPDSEDLSRQLQKFLPKVVGVILLTEHTADTAGGERLPLPLSKRLEFLNLLYEINKIIGIQWNYSDLAKAFNFSDPIILAQLLEHEMLMAEKHWSLAQDELRIQESPENFEHTDKFLEQIFSFYALLQLAQKNPHLMGRLKKADRPDALKELTDEESLSLKELADQARGDSNKPFLEFNFKDLPRRTVGAESVLIRYVPSLRYFSMRFPTESHLEFFVVPSLAADKKYSFYDFVRYGGNGSHLGRFSKGKNKYSDYYYEINEASEDRLRVFVSLINYLRHYKENRINLSNIVERHLAESDSFLGELFDEANRQLREKQSGAPPRSELRSQEVTILTGRDPIYETLLNQDQPLVDQILNSAPGSFSEKFIELVKHQENPVLLRLVPASYDDWLNLQDLPLGLSPLLSASEVINRIGDIPVKKMLLSRDRVVVHFEEPVNLLGAPISSITLVAQDYFLSQLAKKFSLGNYENVIIPEEDYDYIFTHLQKTTFTVLESGLGLLTQEAKNQFLKENGLSEIPQDKFLSEEEIIPFEKSRRQPQIDEWNRQLRETFEKRLLELQNQNQLLPEEKTFLEEHFKPLEPQMLLDEASLNPVWENLRSLIPIQREDIAQVEFQLKEQFDKKTQAIQQIKIPKMVKVDGGNQENETQQAAVKRQAPKETKKEQVKKTEPKPSSEDPQLRELALLLSRELDQIGQHRSVKGINNILSPAKRVFNLFGANSVTDELKELIRESKYLASDKQRNRNDLLKILDGLYHLRAQLREIAASMNVLPQMSFYSFPGKGGRAFRGHQEQLVVFESLVDAVFQLISWIGSENEFLKPREIKDSFFLRPEKVRKSALEDPQAKLQEVKAALTAFRSPLLELQLIHSDASSPGDLKKNYQELTSMLDPLREQIEDTPAFKRKLYQFFARLLSLIEAENGGDLWKIESRLIHNEIAITMRDVLKTMQWEIIDPVQFYYQNQKKKGIKILEMEILLAKKRWMQESIDQKIEENGAHSETLNYLLYLMAFSNWSKQNPEVLGKLNQLLDFSELKGTLDTHTQTVKTAFDQLTGIYQKVFKDPGRQGEISMQISPTVRMLSVRFFNGNYELFVFPLGHELTVHWAKIIPSKNGRPSFYQFFTVSQEFVEEMFKFLADARDSFKNHIRNQKDREFSEKAVPFFEEVLKALIKTSPISSPSFGVQFDLKNAGRSEVRTVVLPSDITPEQTSILTTAMQILYKNSEEVRRIHTQHPQKINLVVGKSQDLLSLVPAQFRAAYAKQDSFLLTLQDPLTKEINIYAILDEKLLDSYPRLLAALAFLVAGQAALLLEHWSEVIGRAYKIPVEEQNIKGYQRALTILESIAHYLEKLSPEENSRLAAGKTIDFQQIARGIREEAIPVEKQRLASWERGNQIRTAQPKPETVLHEGKMILTEAVDRSTSPAHVYLHVSPMNRMFEASPIPQDPMRMFEILETAGQTQRKDISHTIVGGMAFGVGGSLARLTAAFLPRFVREEQATTASQITTPYLEVGIRYTADYVYLTLNESGKFRLKRNDAVLVETLNAQGQWVPTPQTISAQILPLAIFYLSIQNEGAEKTISEFNRYSFFSRLPQELAAQTKEKVVPTQQAKAKSVIEPLSQKDLETLIRKIVEDKKEKIGRDDQNREEIIKGIVRDLTRELSVDKNEELTSAKRELIILRVFGGKRINLGRIGGKQELELLVKQVEPALRGGVRSELRAKPQEDLEKVLDDYAQKELRLSSIRPVIEVAREVSQKIIDSTRDVRIANYLIQALGLEVLYAAPSVSLSPEASALLELIRHTKAGIAPFAYIKDPANEKMIKQVFESSDLIVGENESGANQIVLIVKDEKTVKLLYQKWIEFIKGRYGKNPERARKLEKNVHILAEGNRLISYWIPSGVNTAWIEWVGKGESKKVPEIARDIQIHANQLKDNSLIPGFEEQGGYGISLLQAALLLLKGPEDSRLQKTIKGLYVQQAITAFQTLGHIFNELVSLQKISQSA